MNRKLEINAKAQEQLLEAVKDIKADYAEIRAESVSSTRVAFKGPDPEFISQPESLGFFIRVLLNGSWGVVTFTDLGQLKTKVHEALAFAKLQGKGNVKISQPAKHSANIKAQLEKDFRDWPILQKVNLARGYNQILLTVQSGVRTTNIVYTDSFLTKYFVNCQGANIFQQRPYVRLSYQAVARCDGTIEMYRGSTGKVGGYEGILNLEAEMEKVAKAAVELAKAPKIKSGNYTAILDPFMAGTFAHEAFGHLSEADHQYENPKLLEIMKIGTKLASGVVNIVDDPNLPNGWGNYAYDDEGVLASRVELLKDGYITGRMHSLETSGKLNELPNGHARADGFSSQPIIRMSNTFFLPGKAKLDDLIKTTQNGVLVVNWMGGMTAMENFTFTGMYGIEIKNGKLGRKLRSIKLTGNVFETLKNIDAVTSDFATDQGTCGKMGQSMPVGSGGGYVRVNNVSVGGE